MTDGPVPDLSHKVGPLPVGAWVAIVAGAFLASHFLRGSKTASSTTPTPVSAGSGVPGVNNAPDQADPTVTPGPLVGTPTTNEAWYTRALTELVGGHNYDPGSADNALRNYLAGNALDLPGQLIINRAIELIGPVPSPLPPTGGPTAALAPPTPPAIPTPPPPAPPAPSRSQNQEPVQLPVPIQLAPGQALPPADGIGRYYRNPDGSTFWYG